jgi:hypothetical protein
MTDRELIAVSLGFDDPDRVGQIIAEIEAMDVNSLSAGWQLYLGHVVRTNWNQLNAGQKIIAYLVASELESYSNG